MTSEIATTARLLQAHYSLYRCGEALLTRAHPDELGGEAVVALKAREDECRTFTKAEEAEDFIRRAITEGDVVGIGWPPEEMAAWNGLQEFARHLAASGELLAFIVGPTGGARVVLSAANLPHAAQVIGTASLLGLPLVLEEVDA